MNRTKHPKTRCLSNSLKLAWRRTSAHPITLMVATSLHWPTCWVLIFCQQLGNFFLNTGCVAFLVDTIACSHIVET